MRYVDFIERNVGEYERPSLLAAALDGGTLARLAALRPQQDWRCLEIGAGIGTVSTWLAGQCPDGEVTATDIDTELLAGAVPPSVRVLRHDVTTDDFPEGSFDLIFSRWVFTHLPDRGRILSKAARWLAPGGRLVLEDAADLAGDTRPPLTRQLFQAAWPMALALVGTDRTWAEEFPEPLARAGLCRLELAADLPVAAPGTPMLRMLLITLELFRQPMIDAGAISAADFDAAIKEMTGPDFRALGFTTISACGRRPA